VCPVPSHTQDLLEASRKAFSAGMGEWDLQHLEWSHPEFKARLLQVGGLMRQGGWPAGSGGSDPSLWHYQSILRLVGLGTADQIRGWCPDGPRNTAGNLQVIPGVIVYMCTQSSCHVMSCHVMSCHVMSCHVHVYTIIMSCTCVHNHHVMSCVHNHHVMSCVHNHHVYRVPGGSLALIHSVVLAASHTHVSGCVFVPTAMHGCTHRAPSAQSH
jgi:hypothetical protein